MITPASASAQLPAALSGSQPNTAAAHARGASTKLVTTKPAIRRARWAHPVQAQQHDRPENGERESDVEQHRTRHIPTPRTAAGSRRGDNGACGGPEDEIGAKGSPAG